MKRKTYEKNRSYMPGFKAKQEKEHLSGPAQALRDNMAAQRHWDNWIDEMSLGQFLKYAAEKIRSDVRVHNQTTTWSPMISRLADEGKKMIKKEENGS